MGCDDAAMEVHLVDGTYELFRYHFALPSHVTADGQEVGAMRGVGGSMLQLLEEGATHVGIATDPDSPYLIDAHSNGGDVTIERAE